MPAGQGLRGLRTQTAARVGPKATWGSWVRARAPKRRRRGARDIFLCVPTRTLARESLPYDSATGTITPDTVSKKPLHRSLSFFTVPI